MNIAFHLSHIWEFFVGNILVLHPEKSKLAKLTLKKQEYDKKITKYDKNNFVIFI